MPSLLYLSLIKLGLLYLCWVALLVAITLGHGWIKKRERERTKGGRVHQPLPRLAMAGEEAGIAVECGGAGRGRERGR